tara:strand:- start:3316 stop:3513 length:198 start_codon:yes stop_codon:yes gene_type:complete
MNKEREIKIELEIDDATLAWMAIEAHNLDQKLNDYIVDVVIKYAKEMNEKDTPFIDPDYHPSSRG